MPNFVPIIFVDFFDLNASLQRQVGLFDQGTPRILPIRFPRKGTDEEDEDFVSGPRDGPVAKWVQIKNFLSRLKREAEKAIGPIELGRVFLEMLDPGVTLPWKTETGPYIERYTRLHMALRTNPGTLLISGHETLSPGPGWLVQVNVRVPHTAINVGVHPRIHLVIDFRKKDAADAG